MTALLPTLALVGLTWILFALSITLSLGLFYTPAARRLQNAHPRRRVLLARAAALAPVLGATSLLIACLSPGLKGLLLERGDHCLSHGDHPHLCLVHWTGLLDTPTMLIVALGGGLVAFALARSLGQLASRRRTILALRTLSKPGPRAGVREVPSATPFCFTTGLAAGPTHGEIWISSSLRAGLDPDELDIVLAHERAHVERNDARWRAATTCLSFPLYPSLRRRILDDEALAAEQACDEEAGRSTGDRLRVAETLLAVERLAGAAHTPPPVGLLAFHGSGVAARVRSLLDPPVVARPQRAALWASGAALVCGLGLLADRLHHWTEHSLRGLF